MSIDRSARDQGASDRRPDKASTEEAKMFLARENTIAFMKMLELPSLKISQLKRIVTMAFASRTKADIWKEKIDNYTSKTMPMPDSPGEVYTDPYQDPSFKKTFENACLGEYMDLRSGLDATSKVAMSVFELDTRQLLFEDQNQKYFLRWAGAGRLLLICGEKDSGKTDFACVVADFAMQEDWLTFGNIEMMADVPETKNYRYCRTFTDMLRLVCEAKLAGIKCMLIIDETGLEFASYDASTNKWKAMDRFHKITRKLGVAEVWITQYYDQLPWIITATWSAFILKKDDKTTLRYHIRVGKRSGQDNIISEVPRTRLPFDTSHISSMKIDISMEGILDMLETLPQRANQILAIKAYVEEMKALGPRTLSKDAKKTIAILFNDYLKDHPGAKLTQKVMGEIIGASNRSMVRWKEEGEKTKKTVKIPSEKNVDAESSETKDSTDDVEPWNLPDENEPDE